MSYLIGGGTGLVGSALARRLRSDGLKVFVVTRKPKGRSEISWDDIERNGIPDGIVGVVNTAGESYLNMSPLLLFPKYLKEYKQRVFDSRIGTTNLLVNAMKAAATTPRVFAVTTAVGMYPVHDSREYTEDYVPGAPSSLVETLVHQWEAAVRAGADQMPHTRCYIVRTGVVLGRSGGMFPPVARQFRLGLGGRLGSGAQWFPWIHLDDIVGIFSRALLHHHTTADHPPGVQEPAPANRGAAAVAVLNGVAPEPATNRDFTRHLAAQCGRAAPFAVPGGLLTAMLGAERASIVLQGQWVSPRATLAWGYRYRHPKLERALADLVKRGG